MVQNYLNGFHKLLIFFLFFMISSLHAQNEGVSTPVLKANAADDFNKENYEEALGKYELLLSRYPKDGEFNYYKGLCLFNLNWDMNEAAEALAYASTRPNIPADALYYLGRVYMRSYRFQDAKNSFEKFLRSASRQELKLLDADRQLEQANHAVEFTREYNAYDIVASSGFSFTDSNYVRQVISNGSKLINKPDELMTSGEQAGELANYMFLPKVIGNGDYVYIAGYGKGKKGGSDLFRVKYLNGKKWGPMEPLGTLNTSGDEILPYFDPVGKDLYFASEGHNSMGGFDIFKSHYDEDRNSWSEPLNLGFPLNSTYDDLLIIPGSNLGSVLLITGRIENENALSVYRLNIREPKRVLTTTDPNELKKIANFGGRSVTEYADLSQVISPPVKPVQTQTEAAHQQQTVNKERTENVLKVEKMGKVETGTNLPDSYNKNLKQALIWQFKSDSLAYLVRQARQKLKESTNAVERDNFDKDITVWEEMSAEYKQKADEIYLMVKEMESGRKQVKSAPEEIIPDTLITRMQVNIIPEQERKAPAFPTPAEEKKPADPAKKAGESMEQTKSREQEKSREQAKVMEQAKSMEQTKIREASANVSGSFEILNKSPYSAKNPFPLDVSLPEGPFYTIQLGVFRQKINYDTFGGISPIASETIPGKNMTRYYAGKFNNHSAAVKALETLKKAGYTDSFIVAWYNGQKLPPAKVFEMERRRKE